MTPKTPPETRARLRAELDQETALTASGEIFITVPEADLANLLDDADDLVRLLERLGGQAGDRLSIRALLNKADEHDRLMRGMHGLKRHEVILHMDGLVPNVTLVSDANGALVYWQDVGRLLAPSAEENPHGEE